LHYEVRLGQREIARSVQLAQSTIHEYLSRAQKVGLGWPLPEGWEDAKLEATLFARSQNAPQQALSDFAHLEQELQRHRNLTLQLLGEEYRQANPEGFCIAASACCTGARRRNGMWCCARSSRRRETVCGLGGSHDFCPPSRQQSLRVRGCAGC
jgi:hypothetical protein